MDTNILVITYWSFDDPLIQTYTLPYIELIKKKITPTSKIYLVTFNNTEKRSHNSPLISKQISSESNSQLHFINFRYSRFGLRAAFNISYSLIFLLVFILRKRIRIIHSWCMIGGAYGYILSILTRKILIVDSFEPHCEPMVESGEWKKNGFASIILNYFEAKIANRANYTIGVTAGMKDYALKKYRSDLNNFYVKPACVDMKKFDAFTPPDKLLIEQLCIENKIVCICSGKLGGLYYEQEVFDFFKVAYKYWGDKFRVLFLTNTPREKIELLCNKIGVNSSLIITKKVPHEEMHRYLALGTFAINHTKPLKGREYGSPIKDGEFWAMGLPVIICENISDDSDIIKFNNIGVVIKSFSSRYYTEALNKISEILNQNNKTELKLKISAIAKTYRDFAIADKVYEKIYSEL